MAKIGKKRAKPAQVRYVTSGRKQRNKQRRIDKEARRQARLKARRER